MSKRTQSIRSMFSGQGENPEQGELKRTLTPRVGSGAVRSLKDTFSDVERDYEDLKAKLASGLVAIEIDPALIDPSPLADRFADQDGATFETLKTSIRERGQEVPVLVRPHPVETGRYQSAYGHRRVRAARELGLAVRAHVRHLTDQDLVVAQGLENSAREDLTFIERAFFARRLEDAGFERAVIQSALSVDRAEVSKFISVCRALPDAVVQAIGRAPKIGRGRWQMLVEAMTAPNATERVARLIEQSGFREKPSDDRFVSVLSAANKSEPGRAALSPQKIESAAGAEIGRVSRTDKQWRLTIARGSHEGFTDYLTARIPELLKAYELEQAGEDQDD